MTLDRILWTVILLLLLAFTGFEKRTEGSHRWCVHAVPHDGRRDRDHCLLVNLDDIWRVRDFREIIKSFSDQDRNQQSLA